MPASLSASLGSQRSCEVPLWLSLVHLLPQHLPALVWRIALAISKPVRFSCKVGYYEAFPHLIDQVIRAFNSRMPTLDLLEYVDEFEPVVMYSLQMG